MAGLGTAVNVVTILIGGALGLVLKKILKRRITDTVLQGIGLSVVVIGISGAVTGEHILIMIISLALGGLIGELLRIEDKLNAFAVMCEKKWGNKEQTDNVGAQGFVSATLVFCVGSMAIVGALQDGVNKNADILFAKSALDGITAMIFASTLGIGVLFSAVAVALYQGLITLLAVVIEPYLSETIVTQMSLIGSVLIMAIGLNMLKIAKIKVGNLLPAIFIPAVYSFIAGIFV